MVALRIVLFGFVLACHLFLEFLLCPDGVAKSEVFLQKLENVCLFIKKVILDECVLLEKLDWRNLDSAFKHLVVGTLGIVVQNALYDDFLGVVDLFARELSDKYFCVWLKCFGVDFLESIFASQDYVVEHEVV